MRVFYIFKIKDEFKYLYKDNPSTLFNIFKQIYFLGSNDINYGENIFNQLTMKIDKSYLDTKLFIKLHKEIPYSKKDSIHIINNLYRNEVSRLEIKNTYIKIETDSSYSSFFNYLGIYDKNLFVCDFTYSDYFFINSKYCLIK